MFLAKVIAFSNPENTYNYIARAKIIFEIYLLLHYVLGTKTKLLSDQNFDEGLRSEKIEFQKLLVAQNPSKMGTGNIQNSVFSLMRPESKFWSLESFVLVPRK